MNLQDSLGRLYAKLLRDCHETLPQASTEDKIFYLLFDNLTRLTTPVQETYRDPD